MIRLYLVRHAKVEKAGNPARAISEKGRKEFRKTARALAQHVDELDLILTSPLVRAVQTAELLAAEVAHGAVDVVQELLPDTAADELLSAVATRIHDGQSAALVGHRPSLLHALLKLVGARPETQLAFGKGAIVRVDVNGFPQPGKGTARWWLKPGSTKKHEGLPLRGATAASKQVAAILDLERT